MEPREALEANVRPLLDKLETKTEVPFEKILEILLEGIPYLRDSEKLLIISIERSQGRPPTYPVPKSGSAEFGWLPYLFKHAAETGSIDPIITGFQKMIGELFGRDASTVERMFAFIGDVLMPQITPAQWQYLEANLGSRDIIASDGTIVGDHKYEDLDKDWLYAFGNYFLNILYPKGIAPFVPPAPSSPPPGKRAPKKPKRKQGPCNEPIGDGKDSINIAVIGDWGTGAFDAGGGYDPARLVMQTVANKNLAADYVIHLGDVYYAGTDLRLPPGEEVENFLNLWPAKFKNCSFTLNSNHEMYGGAQGYFVKALNRKHIDASPFSMQNGYSYFALEFGAWVLIGIDAAYHDTSMFYMQGGIGTEDSVAHPDQLRFLKEMAKQYQGKKKIIVLSHQTAMSTDGTTIEENGEPKYPLLSQLQQTGITPDYWYWGHVHLGLVYGKNSAVAKATGGKTLARCVGHSAIPVGAPWGLKAENNVIEYIAQTPLQNSRLVLNGLALLTLHADGSIKERFYNCADTQGNPEEKPQPVWQS